MALDPPLVPKNGHTLRAIAATRVSDPNKQDERSNPDQVALIERILKEHTQRPYELYILSGSGSGEFLERKEYLELIDLVTSQKFDVVFTEDLGRIIRRIHAHLFCEHCVEHGVRLIAINDHIDTAQPGWQDRSIFSAWHHERSNRDTSDRIKRTHLNRFDHGGCAAIPIYGIIKPLGAKSDLEWRKDPDAESVYDQWFEMLDSGRFFSEVADWLNENKVPPGPGCKKKTWDGPMVGRTTHNMLLKGYRYRNKRKTRRNSKGKYVSEKAAPQELRLRAVPHLAFFDEEYYDRVVAKADERNGKYRRKGENGVDPRNRSPKKRTRFPGQLIYCGICGRLYVFGAHGQTDHLMCSGSREYVCWNAIGVDGPLAAKKLSTVIYNEIEGLPDFDEAFLQFVNDEALRCDAVRQQKLSELERCTQARERQIDNLLKFIREGDCSQRVRDELQQLERNQAADRHTYRELEVMKSGSIVIPTIEEVRALARESMASLALDSWEFNRLMHRIIPKIVVFPHRLCDGGNIVLRARFRLCLGRLLPDPKLSDALEQPLQRILTVDLFNPPQRDEFRSRVVEGRKHKSERLVARELGITQTAAQHAMALQRMMDSLNLCDPYVPVTAPPDDYGKLRRHKHKRFHFDALPGAGEI